MVSILMVSHSKKIENGMKDLLLQITSGVEIILPERENDEIGTSAISIAKALKSCKSDEIIIICDIGSSIMNAKNGIELVDKKAVIADCPFVEGSLAAVMAASIGRDLKEVKKEAEAAWSMRKL